jgi:hypothetical protein
MERAGCINDPGAPGASSRELDYRFNSFASRAAEKTLLQPSATSLAQLRGELAREFRDMTLQHCRTGSRKLSL